MPKSEIREVNGYRTIFMPEHPKSMKGNWEGYVYEHIFVAENNIGRPLTNDECVHHLDFNRSNNRKENLIVLLKSQHAKLHMWLNSGAPVVKTAEMKGMNSGKVKVIEPEYCKSCGRTLQEKQKLYCSVDCYSCCKRKVERPSKKELEKDLSQMSWLSIGKKYGVSDNAVRKWAKAYSITKPILSQAASTLAEGAETTGEVKSS